MPPRRKNERRNGDQPVPLPIEKVPQNEHVSHAKFKVSFTILEHSVASQNNQQDISPTNPVANMAAVRIWDFTRMNLPLFSRSKFEKYSQDFLDMVHKVIYIMGITSSESAKLAVYQLQDIAHTWFK